MILQLWHLPLPLPPPVNNSFLLTWCQSLCASCCTVLLYFPGTVMLGFKYFIYFCIFMYYLDGKYYKSTIVQYYIADCVNCVLRLTRLTLLDVWTNWLYEQALGMELIHMQGSYCSRNFLIEPPSALQEAHVLPRPASQIIIDHRQSLNHSLYQQLI